MSRIRQVIFLCAVCGSLGGAAGTAPEKIIREEPVLFITGEDGVPQGRLLLEPEKILKATDTAGVRSYAEGRDFVVDAPKRRIILPPGSAILAVTEAELYPAPGSPRSYDGHRNSRRHMCYSEDGWLPERQIRFTYRFRVDDRPLPKDGIGDVPHFRQKLLGKQPVNIAVFGDSISLGCNATAFLKLEPFQPVHYERFVRYLRTRYSCEVAWHNFSMGGKTAVWGAGNLEDLFRIHVVPDLIILAWGMNDASGGHTAEQFRKAIQTQMARLKEKFPDVEFLLLSSMLPNPEWKYAGTELFDSYSVILCSLARHDGVLTVNLTPYWRKIMERKGFMSLTGNGLNHPNDFGHRIYAEALIHAFER
ncbi:SGNH/GDSL hydrolase family protein [Victivallis vadensis]|uniref:SGNH/GDSL hydrolase family protein n=1 Tax=Victivallis vadensis TaxID=172901 RepID=UPI0023F4F371|nr:SGNH/GDSL hydrolase family protein [Victivallis vadensis]